jgi:hypothetical protein
MSNIFVIQHGRILVKFNQIDGQGGDFCYHNPAHRVRNRRVRFTQNETYFMRGQMEDFNFWKALMRHVEARQNLAKQIGPSISLFLCL